MQYDKAITRSYYKLTSRKKHEGKKQVMRTERLPRVLSNSHRPPARNLTKCKEQVSSSLKQLKEKLPDIYRRKWMEHGETFCIQRCLLNQRKPSFIRKSLLENNVETCEENDPRPIRKSLRLKLPSISLLCFSIE